MKVFELMELLSHCQAGKEVIVMVNEKTLTPYEMDDSDPGDNDIPVYIFASKTH